MANRRVSIRDNRFSYAKVGTFRRSLSKASFKLNILLRSRIFAALLWAIEATLRLVFLDEEEPLPGPLPFPLTLEVTRWPTIEFT